MLQRIAALLRIQPPVIDNRGLLWASGATVPTLGSDGYQTGCIFAHTDGGDGTSLYVNEGTVTSCDFTAVDTAPGEDAGQIIFSTTATAPLIDIDGSYIDQFIESGTYSSEADNGIVISSTNNRPVSFLFDDGGDSLASADYRAGLFRLLLTVDQINAVTLNALRAQIKANNLVDITNANSVTSPFTGYLELDGAGARHLDGHVACVRGALETGAGAHTIDLNLCGFEATLNSSGTFVGDGYTAAFAANISGGTSKWQYGLYLEADAVLTAGVYLGSTAAGVLAAGTIPTVLSVQHVGTTSSHVIDMIDAYTGKVIETGSYSDSASKGITLASGNNRPVSFLYDDGGADLTGSGVVRGVLSRVMLTVDQTAHTNFAIRGQTKLADGVDVSTGIYSPVQGYIEVAGTSAAKTGSTLSCLSASLEITTALEAEASGEVAGLHVETTGAGTLTATGTVAGILLDKAAGAADWPVGIRISNCTTGIDFQGAFGSNVIDFSNATIDPTGSGGPCFIRMGAYGTEIDYGADNHQSGAIRIYTTCSGDISSYDRGVFVCTVTTGAKGAFPVAGLAEANNTGTGPKNLQAAQFIAHLGARSSGAHLAPCDNIAGGSTNGMYGAWLKVCAPGTAVCEANSRVAAAWIDNQMSGTVSGEEYGIFASTGASRPDGFIGFETTSSGYDQLFYFDETFNSGAGTCVTTDSVPGTQDARIKVYYNGTQYYIPLYR